MILMNERLLLLCTIAFFSLACKPNTFKRFLVTYPVLSGIVYSDEPIELETVFPRGRESIDAVPSENELKKHANVECYYTLDLPNERKISEALRKINPALRVAVVTNGCDCIKGNPYLWLSDDNMYLMGDTVFRDLCKTKGIRRICAQPSVGQGHFKGRNIHVGITHESVEYLCRYYGVDFVRLGAYSGQELANQKDRAIRNKVVGVFARQGEVSPDVRRLAETLGIRVVELDPFSHHCSICFLTNFLECVQRTGLGGSR